MPPLLREARRKRGHDALLPTTRRAGSRTGPAFTDEVFDDVDVLLTSSQHPVLRAEGLASTGDARFNRLWTLMRGCPLRQSIPAHVAEGGLPVGVQVIARFGDDAGR
jgi:Asp-tRNA(Asn)/Glu-tRNA(Gln) amidotransferase A subunit family amidase